MKGLLTGSRTQTAIHLLSTKNGQRHPCATVPILELPKEPSFGIDLFNDKLGVLIDEEGTQRVMIWDWVRGQKIVVWHFCCFCLLYLTPTLDRTTVYPRLPQAILSFRPLLSSPFHMSGALSSLIYIILINNPTRRRGIFRLQDLNYRHSHVYYAQR